VSDTIPASFGELDYGQAKGSKRHPVTRISQRVSQENQRFMRNAIVTARILTVRLVDGYGGTGRESDRWKAGSNKGSWRPGEDGRLRN